jgi:hypothetical protein
MGEAKRKAQGWVRLFELPLQAMVAISRPGARPSSTQTYDLSAMMFVDGKPPPLCFNHDCDNELTTVPDTCVFVQLERNAPPIVMGVCNTCAARFGDDELRARVKDQLARCYGLDRKSPVNSARIRLEFPAGVGFKIAGVSFVMPGRETPSIPAEPVVFVDLLEAGKLPQFMTFRRGVSNCHGIVDMLRKELTDAGYAHLFTARRGSSALLKSEHDPDGLHSWIETASGWVIDVANGANRPVIITPSEIYYERMQITEIRDQ